MKRVAVLTTLMLVTACGGKTPASSPAASSPGGDPRTAAALTVAAQSEFDSFAAGNYGAVWDHLDAAGKQLVSRDAYIEAVSACPNPFDGLPIDVVKVTPNPDASWSVELRAGGQLVTVPAAYEGGRWVFPFTARARARFASHDTSC